MKFKSILKKLILENSRFKVLYDNLVVPSEEALKKNPNAKGKLAGTTATKLNDQTNDLEQVELTPFQVLKTIIFADPTTLPCVVGPCVGNVEPTNFDIDGPPGYCSSRSAAVLSKASPAASSKVSPRVWIS